MLHALQITFRDVPRSDLLDRRIRAKADKLGRLCERITSCKVVVEAPHRHHHHGNLFHVRVELAVPGEEIIVDREPHAHHEHEDLNVALRDAFAAAQRRLQTYVRRRKDSAVELSPS